MGIYNEHNNERVIYSSGANAVLRNSYILLAISMIPTVIGSMIGMSTNMSFLATNPFISMILMMVVFFGLTSAIRANSNSTTGIWLLLLFTLLMGVLLGPLLNYTLSLRNGVAVVSYAFISTALIFFGLASWITATGKDLSGMSRFLFIGFIVIFAGLIANIIFNLPVLALALSGGIAILSSMSIAHTISLAVNAGENNYIMLTLSLYINLFNLFTSLLRIFGFALGDRD